MSDYLPADIWSKIFLKLPVESLIRLTAICKSWKSLIISPDFIYAHLSHSKNHFILRRYNEYDKYDNYLPLEFTGYKGSFEMCSTLNPKFPFKFKIGPFGIVGSCDGIVCLTEDFILDSLQPVILWNPSVRNLVVLPLPITNPKGPYCFVLGFGFANNVYKVVRFAYSVAVPPQADIFSIGTERWRSIPAFNIKLRCYQSMWRQVLLKGIIHWLGFDDTYSSSILVFDMGDEVFDEMMLPYVLAREDVVNLCLHKIRESLAVVNFDGAYNVWIMKEYGMKASRAKLYSIDLAQVCKNDKAFFEIIGFKNGEALLEYHEPDIQTERPELISYNLETKQTKGLRTVGTPRAFHIDDYVESLLLLQGNSVPAMKHIGGVGYKQMTWLLELSGWTGKM